jgi:hypothetical protein
LLPWQIRVDLYLPAPATTFYFYHSFPQRSQAGNFLFYLTDHFGYKCGIKPPLYLAMKAICPL